MKKQQPEKVDKRLVLTHSRVRRLDGAQLDDVRGAVEGPRDTVGCNPSCDASCANGLSIPCHKSI